MSGFFIAVAALAVASHDGESSMFREEVGNNRVEHVVYAENKVLQIAAIFNQPFFIQLKEDEAIEDVAGGTIAGWDVHKKGSRLYIRALDKAEKTTLIVTSRSRSYVFDLKTVKPTPENFARRASKIVFDYPVPKNPMASIAPPPPVSPLPQDNSAAKATPSASAFQNRNYSMQIVSESTDIRPREVYDDGRFTWFKFPSNVEIPAIYKSQPNTKEEVLVNSHVEGDYVVMHATAPLWNLRLAQSMIGVFNDSYNAVGVGPENGTTVYGLTRESKK
jgi:type IV secretion system protein VirB9